MRKVINNFVQFICDYNIPICLFGLYVFLTHSLKIQNCLVKWLIGYPCPGCGMTRAVLSILKLDFKAAFLYNPFVFLLPLILLGIGFKHTHFVQKIYNNKWIAGGVIILVLIGYILRFIYVFPNEPMDYFEHNLLAMILSLFK